MMVSLECRTGLAYAAQPPPFPLPLRPEISSAGQWFMIALCALRPQGERPLALLPAAVTAKR